VFKGSSPEPRAVLERILHGISPRSVMPPAVSVGWKRQLKRSSQRERIIVRRVARVKRLSGLGEI
jgi:hypothetical protein